LKISITIRDKSTALLNRDMTTMRQAAGTLTIVKSADLSLVLGGKLIITTTEESLQPEEKMSGIAIPLRIIRQNHTMRKPTRGVVEMKLTTTRASRDIGTLKGAHQAERCHHGNVDPLRLRSAAGTVNKINFRGKPRSITGCKRS
jgi:hypothetical protein